MSVCTFFGHRTCPDNIRLKRNIRPMSLDNLPALFLVAVVGVCLTQHSRDSIFVLA